MDKAMRVANWSHGEGTVREGCREERFLCLERYRRNLDGVLCKEGGDINRILFALRYINKLEGTQLEQRNLLTGQMQL